MRLLRLRLSDYRGIIESEVEFSPTGLTIVEGPNEAGKTSLSEAIRLLFEYLDSSRHAEVKAIKPVDRDEGSEIELEAETGPYAFTYFKRFNKRPETNLKITRPEIENHTGREAHERAEQILRENIDIDLWKALSIQQGEGVRQADLSKQTSLSAALDIAAGGHRTDPREESLFEKVRQEYGRYYTGKGSEKKELQQTREAFGKAEDEVILIETQLRNLEDDAVRFTELSHELEDLAEQELSFGKDIFEFGKALEEISGLKNDLEKASLKLESARKSALAAKRDMETRQDLIEAVFRARKIQEGLEESNLSTAESLRNAEEDLEKARSVVSQAEKGRKEAESLLNLRREDADYFREKLHLEQLKERKARIDQARKATLSSEEILAVNRVDKDRLKSIQDAERSLLMARARLETGAPHLALRGLSDFDFQVDGELASISENEEQHLPVPDRIYLTIPGKLEAEFRAGASSSALREKVEAEKRKFDAACSEAGIGNAEEARQSYDARRDAGRSLARQKETEEENLRDLTYGELEKKLTRLKNRVPSYPERRKQEPELPESLEVAEAEQIKALEKLDEADKTLKEAGESLDETIKVRDVLKEQHQNAKVEFKLKAADFRASGEKLIKFRESSSDREVKEAFEIAVMGVKAEEDLEKAASNALLEKDPDRVRTLEETAQGSLRTVESSLKEIKDKKSIIGARLTVLGENGLQEKMHGAKTHLNQIKRENEALFRRAKSAGLLYMTMKDERDKARRAYVDPLKDRIERLGRLVFNSSFQVEVNEDLSVASRVLDGSSVPFESLSGGTREQISLISRLACAMTVSGNGGAPLILDDTLGYTDSERLKLMGAVLARAGKECQVIVLTCVPDRYRNVGDAKVVRLG